MVSACMPVLAHAVCLQQEVRRQPGCGADSRSDDVSLGTWGLSRDQRRVKNLCARHSGRIVTTASDVWAQQDGLASDETQC